MGNCQAIDENATLVVIQHPNGKVDNLYRPVPASQIMKINPGHYVALLLTTTLAAATTEKNNNIPLRVTRIKLLRPTDTLHLGHVYRLVTTQEVMKGLRAKKQSKMQKQQSGFVDKLTDIKQCSDFEAVVRKTEVNKTKQVKQERHNRSRNNTQLNSAASKSRLWQPSLNSISEAAS
ncbi:hypothetical protein BUALT_Bualt02G0144300 [Buddleja alternifolia]|uniref:DUF4228 domain-containing protein n=1 Tax=Buddleja alternifolia TaxID=168488 RepID=A0AAV6Y0P9_9LAMI|nr:hypothetical protein BUALT_Bualt02G0144300 [Buddleja alternifolia]